MYKQDDDVARWREEPNSPRHYLIMDRSLLVSALSIPTGLYKTRLHLTRNIGTTAGRSEWRSVIFFDDARIVLRTHTNRAPIFLVRY